MHTVGEVDELKGITTITVAVLKHLVITARRYSAATVQATTAGLAINPTPGRVQQLVAENSSSQRNHVRPLSMQSSPLSEYQ